MDWEVYDKRMEERETRRRRRGDTLGGEVGEVRRSEGWSEATAKALYHLHI